MFVQANMGGVEDITSSFTPDSRYIGALTARLVDNHIVIIDISIKNGTPTGATVANIANYAPPSGFRRSALVGSTGSARLLIASTNALLMSGGNATEDVYGTLVYAI